jgi:putative DNA primase/helicase
MYGFSGDNGMHFDVSKVDFQDILTSEAIRLAQSGLSVLPCRRETKSPTVKTWSNLQSEIADAETIRKWYRNGSNADAVGIICGRISGGLECLDFDLSGAAYPEWGRQIKDADAGLFDRLVKQKTQSGGYHVLYRIGTDAGVDIPGSKKIAHRRVVVGGPGEHEYHGKKYKARQEGDAWVIYPGLIETKGEGGLFLCAPSPGYELKKGNLADIPLVSLSERTLLIETAKAFDETPEIPASKPTEPTTRSTPPDGGHLTPLDDFDQRGNVRQLLIDHGWKPTGKHGKTKHGDTTELWTRPGKNPRKGHSAGLIDGRKLTVFSSNAHPFKQDETYSPRAIYAYLECNGDFSEAARRLRREGYGSDHREEEDAPMDAENKDSDDLDTEKKTFFPLTDLGNARRLVSEYGQSIRYSYTLKKWLVWKAGKWVFDDMGVIERIGHKVIDELSAKLRERAKEADSEKEYNKLIRQANALESRPKISNMIDLARSQQGIPIQPTDLDRDPLLLNVKNGVVDLTTGELTPHRRELLQTKQCPVEYDPDAKCEKWETFLSEIIPNKTIRDFLRRAIGYVLTGMTSEQVFFLLYGTGSNGKSVFLEIITRLLADYAQSTPFETFAENKNGHGVRNDLAALRGARFVSASEPGGGATLSESTIKRCTGGDKISARFLYGEFFDYTPEFKIWLAVNHKPKVPRQDHGTWRRVCLIPFTVTIPPDQQDKDLIQKLKSELPGIMTWAVKGCLEWQRDGLQIPESVMAATAEYREEQDRLSAFLTDKCVVGAAYWMDQVEAYQAYTNLCETLNEKPMTNRSFYSALVERGGERDRMNGKRIFRGFGLLYQNTVTEVTNSDNSKSVLSLSDYSNKQHVIHDSDKSDEISGKSEKIKKGGNVKDGGNTDKKILEEFHPKSVTSVTMETDSFKNQAVETVTKEKHFVTKNPYSHKKQSVVDSDKKLGFVTDNREKGAID